MALEATSLGATQAWCVEIQPASWVPWAFTGPSAAKDGRCRAHMDVLVACPVKAHGTHEAEGLPPQPRRLKKYQIIPVNQLIVTAIAQ